MLSIPFSNMRLKFESDKGIMICERMQVMEINIEEHVETIGRLKIYGMFNCIV